MAQPQYFVFDIDLAIARSAPGQPLVTPGQQISAVVVLFVPAGANVAYRFGDSGAPIQLSEAPSFELCPSATEGLRVENPLGAGVARLLVAFADSLTPAS